MSALRASRELLEETDQRVVLRNMPWSHFEVLLALKGEAPVPRAAYLRGDLELMSPSRGHELTKETLGRLVEAYADEVGIDLWGYGQWTLRSAPDEVGVEPDRCYAVGEGPKDVPDLAIEVIWTHRGLDKVEIYRTLGVGELWFWEKSRIEVRRLKGGKYRVAARSGLFPDLDLGLVARLAAHANPSQAVRELRARFRPRR